MMKKIVILTASIFILSACASTDTLSRKEKDIAYQSFVTNNKLESVKHISSFNMSGWESLTNDFFMLSLSRKRQFLLQTKGQCFDLEYAQSLVTHQSTASRLSINFDAVSIASFPKSKCYIKHIYPITKIQYKALQAIGKPVKENESTDS
jgi:hypothetical protein